MHGMNKKYNHVIWDWNGTLMDDLWLCVEVINSILDLRNMPAITADIYHEKFDFPVRTYYERLGFDIDVDTFEVISSEFINSYNSRRLECELHEDATDVLKYFYESNISQSILSAYGQKALEEIISHYEIDHFFNELIGRHDIYAEEKILAGKKHVSTLDFSSDQILVIGDTVHDHEVAEAIGADCILVNLGHHPRFKLEKCNVPIVESIKDIKSYL